MPGTWVSSRSRRSFGIVKADFGDGSCLVEFPPPLGAIRLPHSDLIALRDPLTRLVECELDKASDFAVALRARVIRNAAAHDTLSALTNSRLEVLPHQVFVAHRVAQQLEPRFLLADEVGLGKTIEAGLICKELKARGLAQRILVVAPASLVTQWQRELQSKFNERFLIYNADTLGYLAINYPNDNPWRLNDQIVCSLQLVRSASRRRQLEQVEWDLVIIDEAHHLRRYLEGRPARGAVSEEDARTTHSYRLGELLAARTASLLLLTATPLQLHDYELFSLAELIDPTLFPDYSMFVAHRPIVAVANHAVRVVEVLEGKRRVLPDDLDIAPTVGAFSSMIEALDEMGARGEATEADLWKVKARSDSIRREVDEWLDRELAKPETASHQGHPNLGPLRRIASELRERHKLARIMIRNRKRRAMPEATTKRQASLYPVALTTEEKRFYSLVSSYVAEHYALAKASRDNALGFVMVTFQKMLSSSSRALLAALKRRRDKLSRGVRAIRSGKMDEDVLAELADTFESLDDLDTLLGSSISATEEALLEEIQAIDQLVDASQGLPVHDSKTEVLLEAIGRILDETPEEKVLIFTQFIETQRYLVDELNARGHQSVMFNGAMSSTEKDLAVEHFRRFAPVLVSTEAGGEGRNLQFCHIMFNYDLPWNPMKIEQRIGRVDRIGQKRDVYVYNFAATDTLEGRILTVLHDRIRIFEESVGALDPILGEMTEANIQELVLGHAKDFNVALDRFERELEDRVAEAKAAEESLADLIMDTSSFRRETVDELLGRARLVSNDDIFNLTIDFLNRYPTARCGEIRKQVYRIAIPAAFRDHARERFGVVLQTEYEATFWPDVATQEENADFIAIGHPLFDAILSFGCEPNPHLRGDAAVVAVKKSPFDRDGLLLTYLIESSGGVEELRRVCSVFVGLDGESACYVTADSLLKLQIEDTDAKIDPSMMPLRKLQETAERLVQEELKKTRPDWERRNAQAVDSKRTKVERVAEYRAHRENRSVRRIEQQLEKLGAADDPDQRRVVPLFEGQLREARERIQAVTADKEEHLARLAEKSSLVVSSVLVSAAYLSRL